jgi:hypothetical protein
MPQDFVIAYEHFRVVNFDCHSAHQLYHWCDDDYDYNDYDPLDHLYNFARHGEQHNVHDCWQPVRNYHDFEPHYIGHDINNLVSRSCQKKAEDSANSAWCADSLFQLAFRASQTSSAAAQIQPLVAQQRQG